MIKILSLVALLLIALQVKAQEGNRQDPYEGIIEFLRETGRLETLPNREDYKKRIYFGEIVREELFNSQKSGIYVFGVSTSGTKRFFLIHRSNKWTIYGDEQLPHMFKDASSYFLEEKMSNAEILNYYKRIIEIFELNRDYR